MDVLIITPVKDSLETTRKTIEAICASEGDFHFIVFNDFSGPETREYLEESRQKHDFELIHLESITQTPSPNYKLILRLAQQRALTENVPLIIVESDVIIPPGTLQQLLKISKQLIRPGLVGAVTVGHDDEFNFPYSHIKETGKPWIKTRRSISFCCTLLTAGFMKSYDFSALPQKKDWFDVYISNQKGFFNYLVTGIRVLHLPHSSRPWKQLKYTNPLKYYFHKFILHRDRI
jgi:glycosyltransferase involved in cell wall biosynthesis